MEVADKGITEESDGAKGVVQHFHVRRAEFLSHLIRIATCDYKKYELKDPER